MTKESVTDKPVTRVSLKERLENMKQKVAGMDKHEKVKEKEQVMQIVRDLAGYSLRKS